MGLFVEVNLARHIDDDLHELALRRRYDALLDQANEATASEVEHWVNTVKDLGDELENIAINNNHESLTDLVSSLVLVSNRCESLFWSYYAEAE